MAERRGHHTREADVRQLEQAFPQGATLAQAQTFLHTRTRAATSFLILRWGSEEWKHHYREQNRQARRDRALFRRQERDRRVREAFEAPDAARTSARELSERAGVGYSTGAESRRRQGMLRRKPPGNPMPPEDIEAVRVCLQRRRDTGEPTTNKAIADELGSAFSPNRVGYIRRKLLGEKRLGGWPLGRKRK